ncbi:MAG: protein TolQ [Acidobacteriota bacterium]|nr:MAG: protein TolQ [Acidobacteriota bacterium]
MIGVLAQGSFGSFWSLILQSGPVAQAVLLILLFFSVFSWAIIFKKYRIYKEVEQQSVEFHEEFQRRSSLSEIYRECESFPLSPLAGIFKSGYQELTHRVQTAKAKSESSGQVQRQAVFDSINGLQRTLKKAAMSEMLEMERSLNWLATTGSVTPFIGLFGTVVGIINAFQGLGEGGTTTIQAVAPGISEALVATAAGLFAAIPAVIGYNHFVNRLRQFGAEMDDFSAEFLNLIERSFS